MSETRTVLIASNNAHKAEEISQALDFPGWEFKTLRQLNIASDPEEDAETFLGNARIKAKAAWTAAKEALGHPVAVLADDSGLEVDALGGAPGVHSSRYAGEHGDDAANNEKLLRELEGVDDAERTARFVCTLVFLDEAGEETDAHGTVEGRIGHGARGEHGFGYDPLFLAEKLGFERTLAEALPEEKNAISHRGGALVELREKLAK